MDIQHRQDGIGGAHWGFQESRVEAFVPLLGSAVIRIDMAIQAARCSRSTRTPDVLMRVAQ